MTAVSAPSPGTTPSSAREAVTTASCTVTYVAQKTTPPDWSGIDRKYADLNGHLMISSLHRVAMTTNFFCGVHAAALNPSPDSTNIRLP